MNWTGGTLQRTKHANKGVIQKQRAYFARARTQLQQSPGIPAAPFRPNYLRARSDHELEHRFPSSVSGSVRHTGDSARKRPREIERGHSSPTIQKPQRRTIRRDSQRLSTQFSHGKRHSKAEHEKQRERKGNDADTDIETQLLEANKKRLLRQQDWIGIAPSRPAEMQFLSIKEKSRIGKRRKLDGESRALTRRQSPTGQDELAGYDDTFISGALPILTVGDNIRIRIGSDALTTAASTQPKDYAPSQTNSDPMLFDEEGEDATRRTGPEAPRDSTPASHVKTTNRRMTVRQPAGSGKSYSPQQSLYAHHNLTKCPDVNANERIRHAVAELDALDQSVYQSEATDPSYRLTHRVGGAERSLKLVFGRRSPSIGGRAASPTDQIVELQRVHADLDVERTETGHASQNVGESSQFLVRRHPSPPSIVDYEPWRPYLDTGTSSSGHVRVDDGTGTSVPQPHAPARNTQADRTSWLRYTAQANLTHVNLSKVSASLLASHRQSGRVPDVRPLLRTRAVKEVNNDEAVWRSWVIGSDPQSAIDTIHTHQTSEDSMSRATKGYASTKVLLSNTATPVSSTPVPSTPFKLLSGQVSHISDEVQDAPHSGSRSITSAAPYGVWGRVELPNEEHAQGEDQGEETSACGRFDEQSTHASLQSHASHHIAMFSDTKMSRSDLDQRSRAGDDVSRRAQASGSVVWQRGRSPSIWNIPDSDEAGIDLIDADRLT